MPTIEEIFKEKQDKSFSINEIFSEDKKKETIKPSEEKEFEKAFGTLTNAEIIAGKKKEDITEDKKKLSINDVFEKKIS